MPRSIILLLAALLPLPSPAETINLSGQWRLALDAGDTGLAAGPDAWSFNDVIHLPNTLTLAGKGIPLNRAPSLDQETLANLHQRHSFVGPAWYQRGVEIPAGWRGESVVLELERVLWESRLWVNGSEAGIADSLSTPHRFEISKWIRPGANVITLRIDNRKKLPIGIGHAYTNATQTIWNGAVGNICLIRNPQVRATQLHLRRSGNHSAAAVVCIENPTERRVDARIEVRVTHPDGRPMRPIVRNQTVPPGASRAGFEIDLGPSPAEWCEFDPSVYQIDLTLKTGAGESIIKETYGHRSFRAEGRKLLINGRPVFLRGTLECCIKVYPASASPSSPTRWANTTTIRALPSCRNMKAERSAPLAMRRSATISPAKAAWVRLPP